MTTDIKQKLECTININSKMGDNIIVINKNGDMAMRISYFDDGIIHISLYDIYLENNVYTNMDIEVDRCSNVKTHIYKYNKPLHADLGELVKNDEMLHNLNVWTKYFTKQIDDENE